MILCVPPKSYQWASLTFDLNFRDDTTGSKISHDAILHMAPTMTLIIWWNCIILVGVSDFLSKYLLWNFRNTISIISCLYILVQKSGKIRGGWSYMKNGWRCILSWKASKINHFFTNTYLKFSNFYINHKSLKCRYFHGNVEFIRNILNPEY